MPLEAPFFFFLRMGVKLRTYPISLSLTILPSITLLKEEELSFELILIGKENASRDCHRNYKKVHIQYGLA